MDIETEMVAAIDLTRQSFLQSRLGLDGGVIEQCTRGEHLESLFGEEHVIDDPLEDLVPLLEGGVEIRD